MTYPKALLIDDNQSDRALALRELKKLFPQFQYWEIIDETSFSQALEENKFNIVITDYQLRWTTGLDILERIKQHRPDCPVIMFTGTGSEEIAVEAMKAGLDDYVIKTSQHYVRLAAAVRSAWQRSQDQKALQDFKQTYDRFFERVPLGLYRLNALGEILEANSTLVKLLGETQPEDLIGKKLIDYHVEPQLYRQWQQQLEQAAAVNKWEGKIRRVDGKLIWVLHNAIAVKDSQGKPLYYEGALTNITADKQAELERVELLNRERKAKEEAESLNRVKDEFLATLSHELRTPLNAIMGWLQLLQGGNLSDAQFDQALTIIERNARAQTQLIEDLLDVSRIIRGTMKLNLVTTNLVDIILSSLDTVLPMAEAKKISISPQFDTELIEVKGDEERLQQVFWNLLVNAVKFTPTNGSVTITAKQDNYHVSIEVIDTGQGIAPDTLPYVFERFRQAETKSSTRTQGGLGLGLAIVRHLVELHGGSIIADSQGIGKGATFTVELPLLQTSPGEPPASPKSPESPSFPSLSGVTVLVVEDEVDSLEMITLILQQCGANIITATSVREALTKYEQQTPDILVSDISMPLEDGYNLIQKIRNRHQDRESYVPAIALTAYARKKDRQKALDAGFDLHLPKPIEPWQLVQSVAQLLP